MKTHVWLPLAAAVAALLAPTFSRAQAGDPAGPAVLLEFKHKPGQARRLRFDMKADFTITNEGAAGGLGALPIGLKSTALFTEKVTSLEGPVASLLVTPHSMTMDTSVLGMSTLMKMEGGNLTMNGQPVPPGSALGGMEALLSGKPTTIQRGPLGALSAPGADAMGLGMMMNPSFLVQLPEKAVRVGETWETSVKTAPSLPLGAPVTTPLPEMELKLAHTLKSLDTAGGKRHALITTTGGISTAPEAKDVSMTQTYTGTTRFDIPAGIVRSGRYKAEIKMRMPVPAGLPGAPPAPEGAAAGETGGAEAKPTMQVDGLMSFGLTEAPVPQPKKAAPKKPAPKKRR